MLGGIVGLYIRQSEAAGRVGLVGFLLAFFTTVLVEGDFYTNTFVTPLMALGDPAFLDNPLAGLLQIWLPLDSVLLGLGWLLFAVTLMRTRIYPRAASWLLLVGVVMALVPVPLANLLFEATQGWLGFALLKTREDTFRRHLRGKKRR